jgi:heme/copper-type cytochrome/quinol oxidase subunit 3
MSEEETPLGRSPREVVAVGHFAETPEEVAFELRAAEAATWTGSRLLIGIDTFALSGLAFAYFYLRSSNNEGLWRPGGITAPTGIGAAVAFVVIASAALNWRGTARLRQGGTLDWEVAGWAAVAGGLIAIGLQIYELTRLPFYPGSSGYASCFIGWAAMNVALLASGVYWLETALARHLRLRKAVAQDGGTAGSAPPEVRLFRANVEACSYYWGYIALVSLLFWLLFYVL